MHQWLNARCAKLLEELNNTPFTDDVDEIKLNLIRAAMREASVEMFHRAADSSRKAIEKINKQSFEEAIESVEHDLFQEVMDESEELLKEAEEMATAQPEQEAPASKPTPTMTPDTAISAGESYESPVEETPEPAPVRDTAPVAAEITMPTGEAKPEPAPVRDTAPVAEDIPAPAAEEKPKIQLKSSLISDAPVS